VATGAPEGREDIILDDGDIDKQIQEIVKEIIAKEFEEATLQTKINDAQAEVSIAT
jgi:hypoxanthine-guanine phosphoribosyltransferase